MPNEIKRIVMPTLDLNIDRRIVLEAKSLEKTGKSVFIVAANDRSLPEFDQEEGIEVRRPIYNGADKRLYFMFLFYIPVAILLCFYYVLYFLRPFLDWNVIRTFKRTGNNIGKIYRWFGRLATRILVKSRRSARKHWEEHMQTDKFYGTYLFVVRLHYFSILLLKKSSAYILWAFSKFYRMLFIHTSEVCSQILKAITLKSGFEIFMAGVIDEYGPDAVHAHDLPVLVPAAICAKRRKIPLIYDSHEIYTEQEFPLYTKIYLKMKERFFIRRACSIITVNPYLKEFLAKDYKRNDVVVVENATLRRNGYDPCVKHDLFREIYGIQPEKKIILFQGGFAHNRNLLTLIRGMELLTDDYLLLFMGYGEYRNVMMDLVRDLHLEKKVIFVPPQNQDVLLEYTASADIGVMPYLKSRSINDMYSSPNKLYEYIAAGIPILANNLPFYRDMVERHSLGIVRDIENHENFAEAVREMFSLDIHTFRQNTINTYEKANWENEAKKIVDIYSRMEHECEIA